MVSIADIQQKVDADEPVTMVNAYDSSMARLVDQSDVDMILVGDSVGITMLGYDDTSRVSIEEMVHHAAAVTRVVEDTFVMVDLPFGTYNVSPPDAVRNANRLKKEGSADAVKLEGGSKMAEAVEAITSGGVPVFGHMGVTPQTDDATDGFSVQGMTAAAAETLVDDAVALDDAGAVGLVLELVADEAAAVATDAIDGITIGIGAGPQCDAQVVTLHDLLGLQDVLPKTAVGVSADIGEQIVACLDEYHEAVTNDDFPGENATETMRESERDVFQH
jgi:3-methyl-2-oxobutanoate hydroxymethyltransferase